MIEAYMFGGLHLLVRLENPPLGSEDWRVELLFSAVFLKEL